MPRLFLELFSSVSVKDFQNVLKLQQVMTLRHSIGFQCNLVHEQSTLSPTSCSKKIYDLFFSFLHNFGFSKKWHFADYTTSIGLLIWRVWVWIPYQTTGTSKPCIDLKHGLVFFKFNISLSEIIEWT